MATAKEKAAERPYTVDEMAQIGNILNAAKMPADVAKGAESGQHTHGDSVRASTAKRPRRSETHPL